VKHVAAATAATAVSGLLAGCSGTAAGSAASSSSASVDETVEPSAANAPYPEVDICGKLSMSELNASDVVVEPITEYAAEEDYDIVVVGGGLSGMSAAIAAYEAGAKVCVLQKQSVALGQGTAGFAVDFDRTTESGVVGLVNYFRSLCGLRPDIAQIRKWAENCTEAMQWFSEKTVESGLEAGTDFIVTNEGDFVFDDGECHGKLYLYTTNGGYTNAANALGEHFKEKFTIHFKTPGVQLITDEGKVTGVFARQEDGSILRVNAAKGVILATGDYQNNEAMVQKYLPDAAVFDKKQSQRTGDGHLMGMLVGGQMENIGHCKMIHTKNWGDNSTSMKSVPFLAVNADGYRFAAENIPYDLRNNEVKNQPGKAWIAIFDSNYMTDFADCGQRLDAVEKLEGTNGFYSASTLADLAASLGMDAAILQDSVARYNELCEKGMDLDFAKPSNLLHPVQVGPFYALHYEYAVSAIPSGLVINANSEVLDADGQAIDGLYAAGNCSGPFYACSDYPLEIPGGSISRAITYGYLTGKEVAAK
jgi:succinate dehydrogenase/fumarate reductase flavoprotein subunit